MWLLVLILQFRFLEVFAVRYNDLGCWRDTRNRAIPTLERTDPSLMDGYKSRSDAILKCARVALARNYEVFAIQHGGWCASSANARSTYKKYGTSTACAADGEGGSWANQVYEIIVRYNDLGCWLDTTNRAIPTLERTDPTLMDRYHTRTDPILKCARVALARNYEIFAIQSGGWCASSANARSTYKKYGRSTACAADGEGGSWANQVYEITVKMVTGQTEIEVGSNNQVAYWNVLYNTCLSAFPYEASATATPSDQNSPHRFNVTIVDIQRYSVLVTLKRTDQETGWEKMLITVNWVLYVPTV
ncbi:uncharacterized protein LOC108951050 isoform X1 [Ciona intestinalis]